MSLDIDRVLYQIQKTASSASLNARLANRDGRYPPREELSGGGRFRPPHCGQADAFSATAVVAWPLAPTKKLAT